MHYRQMDPKFRVVALRRRRKLLDRIAGVIINNKRELMKVLEDRESSLFEDTPFISSIECKFYDMYDDMQGCVIKTAQRANKMITDAIAEEKTIRMKEMTNTQHESPVIKTGDAPIPVTSDSESPK